MNRQIKFRCWDGSKFLTDEHFFVQAGKPCYHLEYEGWEEIEKGVIQQFTGLTDRNGKEIYEGDIVSDPTINGEVRKIVHKAKGGEYIIFGVGNWFDQLLSRVEYCKVVGNIFENPGLAPKTNREYQ